MTSTPELFRGPAQIVREAAAISLTLFRIMVPILIAVKIVKELGLIKYFALPLAPVMELVGLPAEMGLVWATAMVNNIYGGIIVLAQLVQEHPLTSAQATVLGTMILVAHGLPVELKIVQESGPRLRFQLFLRVCGAVLLGFLLHRGYAAFGLHTEAAAMLWQPSGNPDPTLVEWALGEVRNLFYVFLVILVLIAVLRVLEKLKVTDLMNRLLGPVLKLIGIGPRASSLTIVGLTMGLSYGGGLIIHEARSGRLPDRDVFYSLSLLGLSHSLIEDTLLLMLIGGQMSGLFWGRLLFSLIVVALLVKATDILGQGFFGRWLWRAAPQESP